MSEKAIFIDDPLYKEISELTNDLISEIKIDYDNGYVRKHVFNVRERFKSYINDLLNPNIPNNKFTDIRAQIYYMVALSELQSYIRYKKHTLDEDVLIKTELVIELTGEEFFKHVISCLNTYSKNYLLEKFLDDEYPKEILDEISSLLPMPKFIELVLNEFDENIIDELIDLRIHTLFGTLENKSIYKKVSSYLAMLVEPHYSQDNKLVSVSIHLRRTLNNIEI